MDIKILNDGKENWLTMELEEAYTHYKHGLRSNIATKHIVDNHCNKSESFLKQRMVDEGLEICSTFVGDEEEIIEYMYEQILLEIDTINRFIRCDSKQVYKDDDSRTRKMKTLSIMIDYIPEEIQTIGFILTDEGIKKVDCPCAILLVWYERNDYGAKIHIPSFYPIPDFSQ